MTLESSHDTTLTASGRIDGHLGLREDVLSWGPLVLLAGDDGLRFEIILDVEERSLNEVEAMIERVPLAVRAAVLAASGTAARVMVDGCSYPDSPTTRRVGVSLRVPYDVEAFVDREPQSNNRGTRTFEAVLLGTDPRLPELYEVFWLGVRALQTIAPLVGFWAFSTVLEDETEKDNLDHLNSTLQQMSRDGFDIHLPKPARNVNQIRASALHANPRNWMPTIEDTRWFHEAARQYLAWRTEKGPSESAKRNMDRTKVRSQP